MAVNPLIAMSVDQVDLATPLASLIQGRERKQDRDIQAQDRQMNIRRQDTQDAQQGQMFEAEMAQFAKSEATQNYARDNLRLQQQLQSGDVENASVTLQGMRERYRGTDFANGLDQDFQNLQSGNIDAVAQSIGQEIQTLERMGALKPLRGSQEDPSAVREYNFMQSLTPEQKQEFLTMKRANPAINLGDRTIVADPTNPGAAPIAEFPRGVSPDSQPSLRGQQEAAVQQARTDAVMPQAQAEREAELAGSRGQRAGQLGAQTQQLQLLDELLDEAADNAGMLTTGVGSLTRVVPGTPAADMSARLNTIRANIGFDKLQDMRANSPTGGALGAVSDRENELLQSVFSSLEQAQSEAQFLRNIERVRNQVRQSWERIDDAYRRDYGIGYFEAESAAQQLLNADRNQQQSGRFQIEVIQ